jgi:hypothetical protein
MEFLRKSTISLACLILFGSAISLGVLMSAKQVIGQPQPLESALQQTNAYNALVTNFIQSHQADTTIGVPLTIPAIQTAIQKAFPPSVVEPAVNQLISGVYAWGQGKTTTLTFRIDLTDAKNNLADYVQQAAVQQAAKLPACTLSQLESINIQAELQNPSMVTCVPPGISNTVIADAAKQAILNGSFLKDPIITPTSLHITSDNQLKLPSQGAQQSVSVPHIYRDLIHGLYIAFALLLVSLGAIIWLHRNHLRGLRRAGATIGWAGLACIIDAIIIGKIPSWLNFNKTLGNSSTQQITAPFQQTITKVATILAQAFHRWLLWYGVILFVVGMGTYIGIRVWQRRKQEPTVSRLAQPTVSSS